MLCTRHPDIIHTEGPEGALRRDLDYLFSDPSFVNAHWGVVIKSLDSGRYLYRLNEHKLLTPASNLKLFTTGTALLELGPEYRFTTDLYYRGQVKDSVLLGDLFLKSCGDPSLSPQFCDGDPETIFAGFADNIRAKGIKMVVGNIIGDESCFDNEPLGTGWAWDDQSYGYSAQISALSFNDNCIDLTFVPSDSSGKPASLFKLPNTNFVHVNNMVTTHTHLTDINCLRENNSNFIFCDGTAGKTESRRVAIHNPALFSTKILAKTLRQKDIQIKGQISYTTEKTDKDTLNLVARHCSPPLIDILTVTNKQSQNLYAELLLRTIAKEAGLEANAKNGIKILSDRLESMGIDTHQVVIADGSGLSRKNKLSPHSLMVFLSYMKKSRYGTLFTQTLPEAGIDGTLKYRMQGTAAQGNAKAKTGSLDGISALSGFVTTQDGEELVFSIIVNSFVTSNANANLIQDSVCERLANFYNDIK
ncbi:D-alanyl-D-alanine carboxypeptidase/D-alanyl-D-alanine-endopeptidase [candidate division KSB1 bacterium]|nr:D-alanyl-D-alanine carboxypeptidase/D-alanyl-D-alanine-endopeptidase [candidate division KSB1 bacterium]